MVTSSPLFVRELTQLFYVWRILRCSAPRLSSFVYVSVIKIGVIIKLVLCI